MSRTVPAPADLGFDFIGVAQGSDLTLDFRLESVSEGVLVSGTARAELTGECARCLDPLTSPLEVEFQQLYVYPGKRYAFFDTSIADRNAKPTLAFKKLAAWAKKAAQAGRIAVAGNLGATPVTPHSSQSRQTAKRSILAVSSNTPLRTFGRCLRCAADGAS